MKPTLVADEMFPEGAGSYIELEEVCIGLIRLCLRWNINFLLVNDELNIVFFSKLYILIIFEKFVNDSEGKNKPIRILIIMNLLKLF